MYYCTFCIMGWRVVIISKRKRNESNLVYSYRPETKRSNNEQVVD